MQQSSIQERRSRKHYTIGLRFLSTPQYGEVKALRLVTDKKGRSKGFAFVELDSLVLSLPHSDYLCLSLYSPTYQLSPPIDDVLVCVGVC